MTPSEYRTHRASLFYPKTDDLQRPARHMDWRAGGPLRKYSLGENDYALSTEARVVDMVSRTGVPVVPMRVVFEPRQSYQEMDVAGGLCISSLKSAESRKAAYADLGRLLAVLHSSAIVDDSKGCYGLIDPFAPNGHLRGLDAGWSAYVMKNVREHCEYAVRADLLDEATAFWVDRKLELGVSQRGGIWGRHCLLHGDLNDDNVLVQNDAVTAILDWEDALIGDPVFELAYWATFVAHTPDTWPSLIDSYYLHAGNKPADFEERFWFYYLRVALSKLVLLHRKGIKDLTLAVERVEKALYKLPA